MRRQNLKSASLIASLLMFTACDSANFGGGGALNARKDKDKEKELKDSDLDDSDEDLEFPDDFEDGEKTKELTIDDSIDSNADQIFDDAEARLRKDVFKFGADSKPPLVDFVFVIDNSVSMKQILTNTAAGFDSLASAEIWPERASIAVMSTMVGDRSDLAKTHPGISRYNGIDAEPGFLEFVDKKAIADFKTAAPGKANLWPIEGCAGKWFRPDAKNASGDSCFKAHTQSTNHGVGCEAGLTAVSQFLEKHKGKKRFRKGSLLNFVFVSDTHDPGCDHKDLKNNIPSLEAIKSKVEADNVIAGLKFHALAPEGKCTGEALYDMSYFPIVQATKGHKQDPCKLNDYSGFIKQMVEEAGKQEDGIFVLSKEPVTIIKVTVNGEPVKGYQFDEKSGKVTISGLEATSEQNVEISYKY